MYTPRLLTPRPALLPGPPDTDTVNLHSEQAVTATATHLSLSPASRLPPSQRSRLEAMGQRTDTQHFCQRCQHSYVQLSCTQCAARRCYVPDVRLVQLCRLEQVLKGSINLQQATSSSQAAQRSILCRQQQPGATVFVLTKINLHPAAQLPQKQQTKRLATGLTGSWAATTPWIEIYSLDSGTKMRTCSSPLP